MESNNYRYIGTLCYNEIIKKKKYTSGLGRIKWKQNDIGTYDVTTYYTTKPIYCIKIHLCAVEPRLLIPIIRLYYL